MKLKKILAAALAGAMVLSVVPIGSYGTAVVNAAENQEATAITEAPSGYELQEIAQELLRKNATSNSQNDNPGPGIKGGPAAWAFDDQEHWWHSHFQTGHPSDSNRIYIQTGFDGETKRIKKLTYIPRTDDKGGIIKDYEIKVSTVDQPGETPENWEVVQSGVFQNSMSEQEVIFNTAVDAKWVRLVAKSNHTKSGCGDFATARKIRVFEEVAVPVTGVTLNKTEANLKVGETVELRATVAPSNASQEVVWSSDAEGIASVDSATGLVKANSAGTAIITATSTMNPEKKAQCTVVVTRDDTALDAAIASAEAKKSEEDYADRYTAASRQAFEDALKIALAAKEDAQMGQGEITEVVKNLQDAIDGLELKAVVTISNNGTEETKYCEIGDQVTVVAKAAPEGKKFSHWTVDEKPICYNESYTFTVYKDIAVTSVYVEEAEEIQKEVSILCDVSYANGKVKFLSKYSVPADEGYKVIKAGVVATDSTGYAAIQGAQQELTLDTTATARLKKYGVNTNLYLANFTQYLKTSRATTWYAKGYVIYQDSNGKQYTVYSDMAQYTIQ